jgi:hypothetical protein
VIPTALTRIVAMLTLSLVGVGAAVAQLPPPPAEQARPAGKLGQIRFENTEHDFGSIWDHEKVESTFVFRNVGSEDLTILEMKGSCGCTVPELEKKVYAPGESGEMTVIFNPRNRQGPQHKTVTVRTDSRRTPTVRVSVKADVSKVLDMEPAIASLGRMFKNEEKGVKVHLTGSIPGFEVRPAAEQPDIGPFNVDVVQTDTVEVNGEMRPRTTLRVWVDEGMKVGRHDGSIKIETSDERRPVVDLRAIVTVIGDLQGKPPRFALGRLGPGESFEKTITLVNRVAEPFKIKKIETEGLGLDLDISHESVSDHKDAYEITVRGVVPGDAQRIMGRIVVHTDMENEPTIELPLYGFVSELTPRRSPAGG